MTEKAIRDLPASQSKAMNRVARAVQISGGFARSSIAAFLVVLALPLNVNAQLPRSDSTNITLSVLSWNLHGLPWPLSRDPAGRMRQVAGKIRELSPQIILLQEVWLGSQVELLVRELQPQWTALYEPRAFNAPKGGLLAFVRQSKRCHMRGNARFRSFTSSAPLWRFWEGDGLGQKGILSLDLLCDNSTISVIDTHLQSQYSGLDYYSVRQSQIRELQSIVSARSGDSSVLIAGDFNTDAREPLYSSLVSLGVDMTADARQGCKCGTIVDQPGGIPQWIDYILVKTLPGWSPLAGVKLVCNRTTDDPYSDHQGVFGRITFTQKKS